jgi:hypothetical protein
MGEKHQPLLKTQKKKTQKNKKTKTKEVRKKEEVF